MADLEEEFYNNSHVLIFTNLDDIGQPYSCNQWGARHVQFGSQNPIITNDSGSTIWGWFRTGAYVPSYAWIDHTMTVQHKGNGLTFGNARYRINSMLDDITSLLLIYESKGTIYPNSTNLHSIHHRPIFEGEVTPNHGSS